MMMLATARQVARARPRHSNRHRHINLPQASFCLRFSTTIPRPAAHLAAHRPEDSPPPTDTLANPGFSDHSRVHGSNPRRTRGRASNRGIKQEQRSKTPILDIYDSCAQHGVVPDIQFRDLDRTTGFLPNMPKGQPKLQFHSIAVAEHGVDISTSPTTKNAHASAFKHLAEIVDQFKDAIANAVKGKRMLEVDVHPKPLSRYSSGPMAAFLQSKCKLQFWFHDPKVSGTAGKGSLYSISITYCLPGQSNKQLNVSAGTKSEARQAALLRMNMSICREHPQLLARFRARHPVDKEEWLEKKPGSKAEKGTASASTDLNIAHHTHSLMQSMPDLDLSIEPTSNASHLGQRRRKWSRLSSDSKQRHAERLSQAYQRYQHEVSPAILQVRAGLPVTSYRRQLVDLVDSNVYSIFIGATGSGKTTQVPHLIFEEWCRRGQGADCNIICTQPRRIAATSVASRVRDEAGHSLKDRVGFQVRDKAAIPNPRDGSITFVTTGIILQQLQHEPDYIFDNVSHLILDEVHERDMVLDFTLTILKRAVSERLARGLKVPRILLMSATLDEELFATHFQNVGSDGELSNAPSLSVPGRTFPVEEKYLEDVLKDIESAHRPALLNAFRQTTAYKSGALKHITRELGPDASSSQPSTTPAPDTALQQVESGDSVNEIDWEKLEEAETPCGLIAETIAHVLRTTSEGAILVFLPGIKEIRQVEQTLINFRPMRVDVLDSSLYRLFQLHSSITDSQNSVFESVPPGVRKIILSSPIAETSVTIPDITCVIDSGQVRETQYDHATRASWLRNSWVNASSAKQRAGRAGRVQSGTYLAMYSRARRESMPAAGVPELMRSDLQSTCLTIRAKVQDVNVPEFLASAIASPPEASVKEAMQSLVEIGALTPEHDLTALGRILSQISVAGPSMAKMAVMGIIFKCLDPILIIIAALFENNLWQVTQTNALRVQKSKERFDDGSQSDLIATYNAFRYMQENMSPRLNGRERAMEEHLSWNTFQRMNNTIKLVQTGLEETAGLLRGSDRDEKRIGGIALNINSHKYHIIKAVAMAGLQSNIAGKHPDMKSVWYDLGDRPNATFANNSLFSARTARPKLDQLLNFGQLEATKAGYVMRHVNVVSPLMVALFGTDLSTDEAHKTPTLLVNKFLRLPVAVWARSAADVPPKENACEALRSFRRQLDSALAVKFQIMDAARQGHGGPTASPEADLVIDRVVQVLDSEAAYESLVRELMRSQPRARKPETAPGDRVSLSRTQRQRAARRAPEATIAAHKAAGTSQPPQQGQKKAKVQRSIPAGKPDKGLATSPRSTQARKGKPEQKKAASSDIAASIVKQALMVNMMKIEREALKGSSSKGTSKLTPNPLRLPASLPVANAPLLLGARATLRTGAAAAQAPLTVSTTTTTTTTNRKLAAGTRTPASDLSLWNQRKARKFQRQGPQGRVLKK